MPDNLPPAPELLGIASCDTCKRALKALAGKGVSFRDVRSDPLSAEERTLLLERFGDALINRRSTTWRQLTDDERLQDPLTLLALHPALMKRPVIRDGDDWTLGWDRKVQDRFLG